VSGERNGAPPADRAAELARRRSVLIARSARLRGELAADARYVHGRLGFVERGTEAARSGRLLPYVVAGAGLLLLARPGRALRLGAKALALWPVVRPVALPLLHAAVPRIVAAFGGRSRRT
jgi:hypothetical protein